MSSLGQKAFAGLLSTGLSKVVLAAVSFVVTAILARQLEPKDFGLIGMAAVFMALLTMLSSLGFDSAIVQKQDLSSQHLSTLFWIKLLVGFLFAGVLIVAAPAISNFYREPRLVQVTRALSLLFVISSLYQIQRSALRKELRFSAIAGITIAGAVVSGIVGVVVALLGGGVWSLVIQILASDLVCCILYWRASSWRPGFVFAWQETMPLIRFGLTMATGTFVLYVQRNIDSLLIGRLLGAAALGYYALAYRVMYSPVRQISYIFTDVLFPSLSTVQRDPQAVYRGYSQSVKFIALITFPAMTLVALFSPQIVQLLFGPQWAVAATVIGILAPAGALQSVTQIAYVVFPVLGRPRLSVVQYSVGCVVLAAGVVAGSRWGVTGTAWGVVVSAVITWALAQHFVARLVGMRWRELINAFRNIIACCLLMVVVHFAVGAAFGQAADSMWIGTMALCVLVFCAGIFLTEKKEVQLVSELMKRTIAARRTGKQKAGLDASLQPMRGQHVD